MLRRVLYIFSSLEYISERSDFEAIVGREVVVGLDRAEKQ